MYDIHVISAKSRWAPILFLLISLCYSPQLNAEQWKEEYYNPQPLADDLILPMPCNGAMAFRSVEIPSNNTLDDRRFELGNSDQDYGYIEGRRFGYLAGAFTATDDVNKRIYYLSKYEVTRDQYAAVMEGQCSGPSNHGKLPVVDVSWFDGIDFSRRYTEWLLQHSQETLKAAGPEPAFLRLPTEEEWEFAARGGLKVDKAEFVASVFPMPSGDLWEYVWYNSSKSAAKGLPHPIGSLMPNPLGLHDILGNAAEMVFTPFHLDHRGRLHGQAGGFVARGCDAKAQAAEIRTSWRQEYNFFNNLTKKANRSDTLGLRLVLTAPVIVSHKRLKEIKKDWSVLPALPGEAGGRADSAIKELNTMALEAKDKEYKQKLEAIQEELEAAHSEINDARNRALQALIRMGAFLGNRVATDYARVKGLQKVIENGIAQYERFSKELKEEKKEQHNRWLTKWKQELIGLKDQLDNNLSYYSDTVINIAGDYEDAEIKSQFEMTRVEFEKTKNKYLIDYGSKFVNHISEWRNQGKAEKSSWLEDLKKEGPK